MGVEVTSLQISVDSSQTATASAALDKLVASSDKAESSTQKLGTASKQASAGLSQQAAAANEAATATASLSAARSAEIAKLEAVIKADVERQRSLKGTSAALAQATKDSRSYAEVQAGLNKGVTIPTVGGAAFMKSMNDLETAIAAGSTSLEDVAALQQRVNELYQQGLIPVRDYAEYTKALAKNENELTRAQAAHETQIRRLLAAYDPVAAKVAQLDRDERLLTQAVNEGAIARDRYNAAVSKIKVDRAKLLVDQKQIKDTASAIDKLGLGSRRTTQDLAQMAGALARGDFTMASNQILQIASRSSALSALMNPLTLGIVAVVAALTAYGIAALKGAQATADLNFALEATGNYAGATADSLDAAARAAVKTGGLTIGTAREVEGIFLSSGQLGIETITALTASVEAYARLSGTKAPEAAKALTKMFEDPLRAADELNKSMHFLEPSTRTYMQTLVESGRKEEARLVLARELYSYLGTTSVRNLSSLEIRWRALGRAASEAWDWMTGGAGGAAQTNAEAMKAAQAAFERAASIPMTNPRRQQRIDEAQAEIARINDLIDQENAAAKREADNARDNAARYDAGKAWDDRTRALRRCRTCRGRASGRC